MKYAADNGAVILQCSWGYNSAKANLIMGYTPGPATEQEWAELYPLEKEALDYFIHCAGSPNGVIDGGLAIFASGNEYAAQSSFPAAYSKCISVSAIAADYTPASYANYGSEVLLSAPGGDLEYYGTPGKEDSSYDENGVLEEQGAIFSTLVVNGVAGYGYYEGTSMACPHVSGVAALGLAYAKQLKDEQRTPARRVYLYFTVYEEVGHGAAVFCPADVTEVIAVDMGCVGKGIACDEHQVSICAKDSHGPSSYELVTGLVDAAKANHVDYAIDVYPYYGSDADCALRVGYDVRHCVIGAGVSASHGYERSHCDGLANTFDLLAAYIG